MSTGIAEINVKNKFTVGDKPELILPKDNQDITVESMKYIYEHDMEEAAGSEYEVKIPCLKGVHMADYLDL